MKEEDALKKSRHFDSFMIHLFIYNHLWFSQAFTAMKVTDNGDDEEEEQDNGDFVNELKTIHSRKLMIQQKLDNFHARQSVNFG